MSPVENLPGVPFHGWQFAGNGACEHVPLNPDAKRDLLAATPLPTREIGGYIWVYTAPGSEAPSSPTCPRSRPIRPLCAHI